MTYQRTREAFYDAVQTHDGELVCQREDVSGDDWFAQPNSVKEVKARKLCMDCPIYWECQGYAIESGIPNGTWGGVDERTRERIWKGMGGKPNHFNEEMDAATLPLLQGRRDFENFDANNPEVYAPWEDAA